MSEHIGLDHLYVQDHVVSEDHRGHGGGGTSIRPVNRKAHGSQLLGEAEAAFTEAESAREQEELDQVLRADGTILVLEGADAKFRLQLDSLTQMERNRRIRKKPKWFLLSARPAIKGIPEQATIWVADSFRSEFLQIFEDFLTKQTENGKPKHEALVANTARIRAAFLEDLWTSKEDPPRGELTWWELWLDSSREQPGLLERILGALRLEKLDRETRIGPSRIVYVRSTWEGLERLMPTGLPLTEIRSPLFILDTIEDLSGDKQDEYVLDLAGRLQTAPSEAPAVCHLDTGVFRGHRLLSDSLASVDQHTIIGLDGHDRQGHGTAMAGLALFGHHLDDHLTGSHKIVLRHRLESVKMLTGLSDPVGSPRDYASTTLRAVSLLKDTVARGRAYCMPISAGSDTEPGRPTLWSAAVDALAVGTSVVVKDDAISLISEPDASSSRLIIVSAGNVDDYVANHLDNSDTSVIEDPGQTWNALTVGAYTELVQLPGNPSFRGYTALSQKGDLSPHSRTSMLFGDRPWPIKPEICMEGGNVLMDRVGTPERKHPLLSLRSVGIRNDVSLTSANATSAATAQAARLAALAMERYPSYWPETIRGLLVHEAQWTPAMQKQFNSRGAAKRERARLLRRYGWGVPTEESVLHSFSDAVTMVVQDQFKPFSKEWAMRELRLHDLPWPREVLQSLDESDVRLRITLSYFIEPSATRRGWRGKYAYASHGLRFDLQGPTESAKDFLARINRQARDEEDRDYGGARSNSDHANRWFLGAQARGLGSLHQDEWTGSGAELAACNHVAIYPVGGWWKNNRRQDRRDLSVRYALLVSLRTQAQDVDLYTPIATQLSIPVSPVQIEI